MLARDAKPERLRSRGRRGPVAHPKLGLLTSGDGHINRRTRDGQTSIYRRDAGSNGLLLDLQGRLVICEFQNRRVTRLEDDGRPTVLADRYEGKRFNQPNDLTIDSQGRIYFRPVLR